MVRSKREIAVEKCEKAVNEFVVLDKKLITARGGVLAIKVKEDYVKITTAYNNMITKFQKDLNAFKFNLDEIEESETTKSFTNFIGMETPEETE